MYNKKFVNRTSRMLEDAYSLASMGLSSDSLTDSEKAECCDVISYITEACKNWTSGNALPAFIFNSSAEFTLENVRNQFTARTGRNRPDRTSVYAIADFRKRALTTLQ